MIPRSQTSLLLSSSKYYCCDDDQKGDDKLVSPSKTSAFVTIAFYIFIISINEQIVKHLLRLPTVTRALSPEVFETERNRLVLARHLSIDAFSTCLCAVLGWQSRRYLSSSNMLRWKRLNDPPPPPPSPKNDNGKDKHKRTATTTATTKCDFHKRLYTYNPHGHRIMLVFLAYQIRNMYDTIIWEDGWLFVAHHVFAGTSAWGAMYPDGTNNKSLANQYAIFYFGVSEISTFVLCLLSNFDPTLGIQGLEEAFPTTKLVLGGLFVACCLSFVE